MSVVIRAEGLGKCYRIGSAAERHDNIRDALIHAAKAPLRNLTWLRSLGTPAQEVEASSFWALREVSFDVRHGEVLGIIGRNGAGKSTLLKVLSRITEPTAGVAEIKGRVGALLEVGTGFHPELTGRKNVYLNGSILGMDRQYIDRSFDEIVDFAGVSKFIDTPVKRYSSGMYLRLAFAVAAHLDPEILVIDEVLAVGDAEFQRKCLGKMSDVAKEGRTVLFISHNLPALTRLCARAVHLHDGHLIQDGPSEDVVTAYLRGAAEQGSQRVWDAERGPGTDAVRLREVGFRTAEGQSVAVGSVGDELELRISYDVGEPGTRFRCAAMFYTQGVCAFASVEPTEVERKKTGTYVSFLKIPPHLLAEGEYTVNISIFTSRGMTSHFVRSSNVASILIVDPLTGDSARGDFVQNFGGVLRPRLTWAMAGPDSEPIVLQPVRAVSG